MRIAVTGFVEAGAGSIASANAFLLRELLGQNIEVVFFSKASFVDPRPSVAGLEGFTFENTDNRVADRFRRAMEGIPIFGAAARMLDVWTYNRLLIRSIRRAHARLRFDLCLWLGDYARGRVPGLRAVSFGQGPPGTDARSVLAHSETIARLAGPLTAAKWKLLARARLSSLGLPAFRHSDHIIVGSSRSRESLHRHYGIPHSQVSTLPYPIALDAFRPGEASTSAGPLRCLWLGRIVPRKRLDLFLDGAAGTIRAGNDIQLTIVGSVGFIRGYEQLINAFPYPRKLTWIEHAPHSEIPAVMDRHDLLVQPSEEEDFGSSVAEAQACGLPVLVGATNGMGDYLCQRDLQLTDYRPESLTRALVEMAARKRANKLGDPTESRRSAVENFSPPQVGDRLAGILRAVIAGGEKIDEP